MLYFTPSINPTGAEGLRRRAPQPNVFIKIDGLPQPDLRLFHAPGDARVAGQSRQRSGARWNRGTQHEGYGIGILPFSIVSNWLGSMIDEVDVPSYVSPL